MIVETFFFAPLFFAIIDAQVHLRVINLDVLLLAGNLFSYPYNYKFYWVDIIMKNCYTILILRQIS